MGVRCPIDVNSSDGLIKILAHDLPIALGEKEARQLFDWLELSLTNSVVYLLRLSCPGIEIEGRNYDKHLDFLVYADNDGQLSARTFSVPKNLAPALVERLANAIERSF